MPTSTTLRNVAQKRTMERMAQPMSTFPQFHLGDRLRKARESAGYYNAVDFAPLVDISRDTLRKYERNEVRPRRHVLIAWAELCGVTYDALVGGDDGGGAIIDLNGPLSSTLRDSGCIADWSVILPEAA